MDIEEQLMQALDANQARWLLDWADQQDLLQFATGQLTKENLRLRVVRKVWPVIHAALCAGLVREVE